jgi:hypothetical protein
VRAPGGESPSRRKKRPDEEQAEEAGADLGHVEEEVVGDLSHRIRARAVSRGDGRLPAPPEATSAAPVAGAGGLSILSSAFEADPWLAPCVAGSSLLEIALRRSEPAAVYPLTEAKHAILGGTAP